MPAKHLANEDLPEAELPTVTMLKVSFAAGSAMLQKNSVSSGILFKSRRKANHYAAEEQKKKKRVIYQI